MDNGVLNMYNMNIDIKLNTSNLTLIPPPESPFHDVQKYARTSVLNLKLMSRKEGNCINLLKRLG